MRKLLKGQRVVVIVAHYDDEILYCGGTLATGRGSMRSLTLVIATGIETTSAPRVVPSKPGPSELERRRARLASFESICRDLKATGVHLGAHNLSQVHHRGSAPYGRKVDDIRSKLREVGCLESCDVVLTHGMMGEYGHPQHQAVHDAVLGEASPELAVATFATPQRFDYRVDFDPSTKRVLIDRYRNQGPHRGPWKPEEDTRMSAWTKGVEWFSLRPRRL